MNDHELLILAAKAAGVKGSLIEFFPEDGAPAYSFGVGWDGIVPQIWNPLTSDRDAFQLAVKLGIDIASACQSLPASDADIYAHARRHITCAAANMFLGASSATEDESAKQKILILPWDFIDSECIWAAMDKNGAVNAYEGEPHIPIGRDWWDGLGEQAITPVLVIDTDGIDWRESLVRRPSK